MGLVLQIYKPFSHFKKYRNTLSYTLRWRFCVIWEINQFMNVWEGSD